MTLTTFEAALMLHLIGDWLLQNEWIAVNKVRWNHPAAWIHGAIHGTMLGLLFGSVGGVVQGVIGGVVQAVLHMFIDTRAPIRWWIKVFKKCDNSPDLPILLIGCDQVLHLCCIAGWIAVAPHLFRA